MFRADGSRENVWASRNNIGVFEKLLKWQADVGGELKNARDLNAGGASG